METPSLSRRRKVLRLSGFDYRTHAAYFVTICTENRRCTLDDSHVVSIVTEAWRRAICGGRDPSPWEFVVMPNHVHGIVWLPGRPNVVLRSSAVGAQRPRLRPTPASEDSAGLESLLVNEGAAPLRHRVPARSLGAVVRAFKSAAALRINALNGTPGAKVWQPNYYDRVIRSDRALEAIQEYILSNPLKWADDPNHPSNIDS